MRIFVSSTSDDLREYRALVVDALRISGHEVVSMESYTADARSPVEKCLADVASAEAYVGLFAFRYGSVATGYDVSITELEFRKAGECDIPRLVFLVPDNAEWSVRFVDRGQLGERMESLRKELLRQEAWTAGFFSTELELMSQLPGAINGLEAQVRSTPPTPTTREHEFRELIQPLSFEAEKSKHLSDFTGRKWVEERLDDWIAKQRLSRVFCLLGGPGIGKSAIAAHWCHTRGDIVAFHHCVHDHAEKTDPRRTFLSLAAQIADHLPEYGRMLARFKREELQEIVKGDTRSVFENLLLKPLTGNFPPPDSDRLVVIDGLDEATKQDSNELAKVIGDVWIGLPEWLRLVVTSRPELDVSEYLSSLHPFILNASSPENMRDIRMFLRRYLPPSQASDAVINTIVAKSEGMFLYAVLVLDEIRSEELSLSDIADFPQGLTGYYKRWFSRKFPDHHQYHKRFHKLVSVITAQKAPLPLDVLGDAVGQNAYDLQMNLYRLGVLFPLREQRQRSSKVKTVTFMHKSLRDWLTEQNPATLRPWAGTFASDPELGNQLLAEEGWRVYCEGSLSSDAYFSETLLAHLREDHQSDRLARVLLDPKLLDSMWFNAYRVQWQRHISSLRHELSLSKLLEDWLRERDSAHRRTASGAVVAGKLCRLLQEIGAFDEAMLLGEAALANWKEHNVKDSPDMVVTYLALGGIQAMREQLEDATKSHEKALEIAERAYVPDGPQMADVLYSMLVFYTQSKRDYKTAAEYLDRCYRIWRECDPPNLVGMANCVNDRAVIYTAEGKSADNLSLYREALSLFEEASPEGHPEMVSTLTNVAFELRKKSQLDEAIPFLRRAVAMADMVLLPQHQYSRLARYSLSSCLLQLGHHEEGLDVVRDFVAEHERFPGPDHVDTATARLQFCLALWQVILATPASAGGPYREEVRQQCLKIRRARPATILGLLDLAQAARRASEMRLDRYLRDAVRTAGRGHREAAQDDRPEELLTDCYGRIVELIMSNQPVGMIGPRVTEIWNDEAPRLEPLGVVLPETRKAIAQLIGWYGRARLNEGDDAESVMHAFDLITRIGADSPDTLDNLASLAVALHKRKLDESSELLCERLFERGERVLGANHVQTLTYLENLAFLKMYRRSFDEAGVLFQESLERRLADGERDSLPAISTVAHIAECLLLQHRIHEARDLISDLSTRLESGGQTSPHKSLAAVLNSSAMRLKNEFARYDASRVAYEMSLQFDPDEAVVHSNLALLLWACLDANEDADRHFRKSLALNDHIANTHSVYGLFLGQTLNSFERALAHFDKAAVLDPNSASNLANRASVLLVRGDVEPSWRACRQAMRLCQPNPDRIMARVLYCASACLLVEGKAASGPLGQLKTLFARGIHHAPWLIPALLGTLERQVPGGSFSLMRAVSQAINDKMKEEALEGIASWQVISAVPLDAGSSAWPSPAL